MYLINALTKAHLTLSKHSSVGSVPAGSTFIFFFFNLNCYHECLLQQVQDGRAVERSNRKDSRS